jgi:hypothetical protein
MSIYLYINEDVSLDMMTPGPNIFWSGIPSEYEYYILLLPSEVSRTNARFYT